MSDVHGDADVARSRLLSAHEAVANGVLQAADAVADEWPEEWTTSRAAIVAPFRDELSRRGVLKHFPDVLSDAVRAAGYTVQATPVPAPPYVIVTSRGPILRATVRDGRLVVAYRVFEIERTKPPRYYRCGKTAPEVLSVRIIPSNSG